MAMTVKRIFDLVKAGLITVKDPSKGFTVNDLNLMTLDFTAFFYNQSISA